jgi:hypothetical protein
MAALDGPDGASRMVMFRVYYLGLAPYQNARHFLCLSERSWVTNRKKSPAAAERPEDGDYEEAALSKRAFKTYLSKRCYCGLRKLQFVPKRQDFSSA